MPETSNPKKKRPKQLALIQDETQLSRRKLPKYTKNPFIDDEFLGQLSGRKNVYYTQTDATTIIDLKTKEITSAQTQIKKTIKADKENFVKIFTTHLKAFFELNQTAYKILQYVLYTVQHEAINKDTVYLNLERAQQYFETLGQTCSKANYYRGMKDLVAKLFIAETTSQNQYFINAKLFFNGDRVEFLTTFDITDSPRTLEKHEDDMKKLTNQDKEIL